MSDLDQYLTEEVVEKAAVAIQLVVSIEGESRLVYLPEYEDLPDEHKQQRQHEARRALEAVLPDIIRQVKAEALRDFASASNTSEFHIEVLLGGSDYVRHVLRDRADRIEGGQP